MWIASTKLLMQGCNKAEFIKPSFDWCCSLLDFNPPIDYFPLVRPVFVTWNHLKGHSALCLGWNRGATLSETHRSSSFLTSSQIPCGLVSAGAWAFTVRPLTSDHTHPPFCWTVPKSTLDLLWGGNSSTNTRHSNKHREEDEFCNYTRRLEGNLCNYSREHTHFPDLRT